MFREQHKLSNLNKLNKKATCSQCGVVDIKTSATNPRCRNSFRDTRSRSRKGDITKIPDELAPAILREAVHRSRARKNGLLPDGVDINLMKNIYIFCPKGYEVDHIVPFARSGLHEPDNLQYLPINQNRTKHTGDTYDKTLSIQWQKLVK